MSPALTKSQGVIFTDVLRVKHTFVVKLQAEHYIWEGLYFKSFPYA